MAIVLPHVFQDNVSETASGVQVNENFNVLKAAIEALEALSPTLLHKPTGHAYVAEAAYSTLRKESTTRDAHVTATVNTSGAGCAVEILVNGERRSQVLETTAGSWPVSFVVPANQEWQAKLVSGTGMRLELDVNLL